MSTQLDPDEILRRIRAAVAEGRNRKVSKLHRPPVVEDFTPDVQILAFDQTLTNCGWCLINTEDGDISVPDSGTIRPPVMNQRGFEATLTKSIILSRHVADLLQRLYGQFEDIVLELPSVVGYRTESSLVAAVTICVEADRLGLPQPHLVSRQAAGSLLCGDRHAPKAVSSETVNRLVTKHPTGTGQWTEHVRDGAFVGLKNLYLEAA